MSADENEFDKPPGNELRDIFAGNIMCSCDLDL